MGSRLNLGAITAYAIAVKHGFEGTEEEWLASLNGGITIDDELSETSKNPVENQAVTKELNEAEQNAKNYTDQKFNGANKAVSFVNYSSMISSLNDFAYGIYNIGQNIMIVTLGVPDLWVSSYEVEKVPYTYISDTDFINELATNGSIQVGHYRLSALETQKVDLTEYVKNTDIASENKLGLILSSKPYAAIVNKYGYLACDQFSLDEYKTKSVQAFIGKGALENIKNDYVKRGITENDIQLTEEEKAKALAWLGAVGQTELENKVDKVTTNSTYAQAYIKYPSGEQGMANISHLNKDSGFIPSYAPASSTVVGETDNGGTFAVAMPQQPYQPAPKKYVDDAASGKLDKPTTLDPYGRQIVVGLDANGNLITIPTSGAGALLKSNSSAMLDVPSVEVFESNSNDRTCTPKMWVLDQIANAGGTKWYQHTITDTVNTVTITTNTDTPITPKTITFGEETGYIGLIIDGVITSASRGVDTKSQILLVSNEAGCYTHYLECIIDNGNTLVDPINGPLINLEHMEPDTVTEI